MDIQADRRQEGGLATTGWDEEGVPGDQWLLITRQHAAWIATSLATTARTAARTRRAPTCSSCARLPTVTFRCSRAVVRKKDVALGAADQSGDGALATLHVDAHCR
jgi:hypothetical protein